MTAPAAAFSSATQATPARHLATPWRVRAPQTSVVDAIPADAADWLRARFDWTFGAVWVAQERWNVGAETVVAWAEALRAGGARAGLSSRERAWILAQLNDPDQQPTEGEMEEIVGDTYTYTYPTCEATCAFCGKTFTAHKYSGGWTRFCSSSCGGKARHFNPETLLRHAESVAPAAPTAAVVVAAQVAHAEVTAAAPEPLTAPDVAPEAEVAEVATPAEQQTEQDDDAGATEPVETAEASESVAAANDDDATLAQDETPDEPDLSAGYAVLARWLIRLFKPAPQPQFPLPLMSLSQMAGGAALGGAFAMPAHPTKHPTKADDEPPPPQPPTYPLLRALLDRLPTPGSGSTWTRGEYDRWLRAFTAMLELDVVIVDDAASSGREA